MSRGEDAIRVKLACNARRVPDAESLELGRRSGGSAYSEVRAEPGHAAPLQDILERHGPFRFERMDELRDEHAA